MAAGAAGERPTPAPQLRARHDARRPPPPAAPKGKGGSGGRGAQGAPPRKKTPAACRRPLSPRRRKRAATARRRRPLWSHKGAAHEPRPRRNGGAARPKGRGRALRRAPAHAKRRKQERKARRAGRNNYRKCARSGRAPSTRARTLIDERCSNACIVAAASGRRRGTKTFSHANGSERVFMFVSASVRRQITPRALDARDRRAADQPPPCVRGRRRTAAVRLLPLGDK